MNYQKIYNNCSYLLAVSIAFPQKVSSYILGIWSISYIIANYNSKERISITKENISNILLLCLSFIGLTYIFYTEDYSALLNRTFNQRLTIIILPILALLNKTPISFDKIIKCFILGNFLFISFSHLYIIYDYSYANDLELFRSFATEATNIYNYIVHRSYSALNIQISYIGIFYLWNKNKIKRMEWYSVIMYIIYSLHFIIFNNPRAATIGLLITTVIAIFIVSKSKKKLIISSLILVTLTLAILIIPNRSKETIEQIQGGGIESINEPRLKIWRACNNLISGNFLLIGYGVNNIEKPLKEEYNNIGFYDGIIENFNTHNQFLESWLEIGLIGPILLTAILIFIPIGTSKDKKLFAILFSTSLFVSFLFEAVLNRYSGCITLSFFLFFLASEEKELNETSPLNNKWSIISFAILFSTSILALYYCSHKSTNFNGEVKISSLIAHNSDKNPFIFELNKSRKFYHDNHGKGYHIIGIYQFNNGETGNFEIDCFVSDDFNGKEVLIYEENAENTAFIQASHYNLTKKNEWQKLSLELYSNQKRIIICLQSYDLDNFNNRKGVVKLKNASFDIK